MDKLSLLIIDDHQMMIDGLKFILGKESRLNFKTIDASKDAKDAIAKVKANAYDIVLMDISIDQDNGIELTKEVLKIRPSTKVLGLSMHKEVFLIKEILKAGAKGYVVKGADSQELTEGISTVLKNKEYLSQEIKQLLKRTSLENEEISLTPREAQILDLIVKEKTNEEIAKELGLAKRTVDGHRQRMLEKLDTRNTVGLIKKAVQKGLIQF